MNGINLGKCKNRICSVIPVKARPVPGRGIHLPTNSDLKQVCQR